MYREAAREVREEVERNGGQRQPETLSETAQRAVAVSASVALRDEDGGVPDGRDHERGERSAEDQSRDGRLKR